jgi:tetratricopeptide (TPR) repeat protein
MLIMVSFLENNREIFNILLSFLVMSKGFKFAFAEINFPPDIDELITALQAHEKCQDLQLVVLKLDDPDLHFLLETLKQHLLTLKLEPEKKLVLILRGLEKAIGTSGNNPAILTNLNYARDSFPKFTPHPILFILPDYAVTRFAKFAPDFWAWTSANFRFQTVPEVRQNLLENAFHPINSNRTYAKVTKSENIELLTRLLQEYTEETEASQRTRIELLQQLGKEHQSVREFTAAKEYLQEALMLCRELQYQSGEAESLFYLGNVCLDNREFVQSRIYFQQALPIYQTLNDQQNQAGIYHQLGRVAEELREYEEARKNYQQALAIYVEFGDRYEQAGTYHQLGIVAQELREYEEARNNYQQALAIYVEFGDRYSQARTYHQLGIVAQELREYEEARNNSQQALAIYVEFGDRYSQASTYHQLGRVAEELREYEEARNNYQQALAIKVEFGDRYSQANTYGQLGLLAEAEDNLTEASQNLLQALAIFAQFKDQHSVEMVLPILARLYQTTQDPSILEAIAQLFGITVDQIATLFEEN